MIRRGYKSVLALMSLVTIIFMGHTPVRADVYEDYIQSFFPLAQEEQEEFGIPASITLAQGLLESSAGRSTLAREGNNHFGIKCHNEWEGETMLRDDDAPNECFRVYENPRDSYRDHSKFLQRERYKSLYDLSPVDYQGWAQGLSRCGYATDPKYAERLITIIERYALYGYDQPGYAEEETVAFIRETLSSNHPLRKSRGLHYVLAFPGDTYKSLAAEFGISEKKLKEYNDVESHNGSHVAIKEWEEIYLEPKCDDAPEDVMTVTIGEGETIRSISQRYGMKLSELKRLNKKAKDKPGTVLKMRKG